MVSRFIAITDLLHVSLIWDGAPLTRTIAVAADNADPGRNGVAGGETADDNFGAPKLPAAGLPPLHIGDRGIPLIGHNVFPLEAKDNTITAK